MSHVKTIRTLLCSLLAMTSLGFAPAIAQSSVAVQYLFSAVNQERAKQGLGPLRMDAALTRAAQAHAVLLADRQTISHRFDGEADLSTRAQQAGASFNRIAENVAEGPTAAALHDAWMHSPGHRANILDPAVDAIGIAVVVRDGQLYAVQDFDHTIETLSLEQQEEAVGAELSHAGLELLHDSNARQTCAMSSGFAGQKRPDFVMRYTTTDLSKLPEQLQARLARARGHHAAVGACPSGGSGNFSNYSIAVILYP